MQNDCLLLAPAVSAQEHSSKFGFHKGDFCSFYLDSGSRQCLGFLYLSCLQQRLPSMSQAAAAAAAADGKAKHRLLIWTARGFGVMKPHHS